MNGFYCFLFIESPSVDNFKNTCINGETVVMSGCECLGRKRFELATCGQATVSRKDPSWHFTFVFSPTSLKHSAFLMYSGNTVEFEDRCWNAGRLSRGCLALQGHSDD